MEDQELELDFHKTVDYIMKHLPKGSQITRDQVETIIELETDYMIELGIAIPMEE